MQSIERAIRNAFAKANTNSSESRQRIYEAAWGAHERALSANANLSDEQKDKRRQSFKKAISAIEQEYASTPMPAEQHELRSDISSGSDPVLHDSDGSFAPSLDTADLRPTGKKQKSAYIEPASKTRSSRKAGQKKRGSRLYRYGLPALVILVCAFIGYSLYNSFTDFTRRTTTSPLHADSSMAPIREGEDPSGRKWIVIFQPSEATRMTVNGRATATIATDGRASFARIATFGQNEVVTFDVGEGILNQLAGKQVTFDIAARSDGGNVTQMTVSCDFSGMGDCGRRRYDVGETLNDFLFDVTFSPSVASRGAGKIMINSDLTGSGKPVDIYSIRVTASDK